MKASRDSKKDVLLDNLLDNLYFRECRVNGVAGTTEGINQFKEQHKKEYAGKSLDFLQKVMEVKFGERSK